MMLDYSIEGTYSATVSHITLDRVGILYTIWSDVGRESVDSRCIWDEDWNCQRSFSFIETGLEETNGEARNMFSRRGSTLSSTRGSIHSLNSVAVIAVLR